MGYKVNDIINVKIVSIVPYGVFVKVDNNYTGLIHISEINGEYIRDIKKYFEKETSLLAKIISIDEEKKQLSLSTKNIYHKKNINKNRLIENGEGFFKFKIMMPKWIEEAKQEIANEK